MNQPCMVSECAKDVVAKAVVVSDGIVQLNTFCEEHHELVFAEVDPSRLRIRDFPRFAADRAAEYAVQLGKAYALGSGVPQDVPEAIRWFEKAAQLGAPEGEVWLFLVFSQGVGTVPVNQTQAMQHSWAAVRLAVHRRPRKWGQIWSFAAGHFKYALGTWLVRFSESGA